MSISPSALNRAIQGFEEELGMPLFDRLSGGVQLSTAGELIFSTLDAHLTRFDSLTESLTAMRDGMAGNLTLGVSSDLVTGVIPLALAQMQANAPALAIDMQVANDGTPLATREVDLSILTHAITDDHFAVITTFICPLVAICPRDATGAPALTRVSDLADCRVILPPVGTGTRICMDHLFRKHRLTPRAVTVYPGLWTAPLSGPIAEVQILPSVAVPPLPEDRAVVDLPLGKIQLTLLRRAESPMLRSTEMFVTRIRALLDQH